MTTAMYFLSLPLQSHPALVRLIITAQANKAAFLRDTDRQRDRQTYKQSRQVTLLLMQRCENSIDLPWRRSETLANRSRSLVSHTLGDKIGIIKLNCLSNLQSVKNMLTALHVI
jgi:hypothetical protein